MLQANLKVLIAGFLSLLYYESYRSWHWSSLSVATGTDFDWERLVPNEKLDWVDCYTGYQCARLKVPLDYSELNGESAAIALIRIPSPYISSSSPAYRGPVILNPGGPGGDGVGFILSYGRALSTILGPHFDVVSFDPRGIGRTTPRTSFFGTDAERALWDPWMNLNLNTTEAIPNSWARAQVMGRLAEERHGDAANHVTTDVVARDMLQIIHAYGRDKIQYWGISYGSVLGATFAAMFPDHVERLLIDGVADSQDYFAIRWKSAIMDTERAMQAFFSECASAGPEGCRFYAPTPLGVSQRLAALYESIRTRPVAVLAASYGIVDYSMMRQVIFDALYYPYARFSVLGRALSDLESGDGALMFEMSKYRNFECQCGKTPMAGHVSDLEAQIAIMCSDAEEVSDSPEELRAYYDDLLGVSSWADIIGILRIRCSGWRIRVRDHFTGPFISNTSHPILLIGNTADPITPLSSAHKMSKGFPGSVVLTQDSIGHSSIAAPSLCTRKYIRQYFEKGTLPDPGTICPVDFPPFFNGSVADIIGGSGLGKDERESLEAALQVSRSIKFRTPI